jgi:hypothetical protein
VAMLRRMEAAFGLMMNTRMRWKKLPSGDTGGGDAAVVEAPGPPGCGEGAVTTVTRGVAGAGPAGGDVGAALGSRWLW